MLAKCTFDIKRLLFLSQEIDGLIVLLEADDGVIVDSADKLNLRYQTLIVFWAGILWLNYNY
ncbi:hypothetical protein C0J52_14330 [Blattella germanica]|nr:hypothetical protein C0J52_14330 [Blattella germanica]